MSFLAKAATRGLDMFADGLWVDTIRNALGKIFPQGDQGLLYIFSYAIVLTIFVLIVKNILDFFVDDEESHNSPS